MNTTKVYEIFRRLNAIPRASHHEEKVADFLCSYARSLGLEYRRDKENCVVIRKAASKGCEQAEPIVLLNHMDMVAVSDGSRPFNPLTDGIEAYTEDGWMKARGTSLGADNGIGLSMALAVLADDSLVHPALEVLTTTNEEDGMSGAANLSTDFITGRKVINLDSEDYDTITVGAAGAYLQTACLPVKRVPAPEGLQFFNVSIRGGLGGHSGVDINKKRLNVLLVMCALLYIYRYPSVNEAQRKLYISHIQGGSANASIPSDSTAIVGVPVEEADAFRHSIQDTFAPIAAAHLREPDLKLSICPVGNPESVMTDEEIVRLILGLPSNVIRMRDDMPDTVMTSNNIGMLSTDAEGIRVSCHTRSFDDNEMIQTAEEISRRFRAFGAEVKVLMNTPGWQEKTDSDFLNLVGRTFKDVLGFEPRPVAMHFVLEAGYYVQKYPGIQIACIGPRIIEPHSTKERVELSTIDDIFAVLVELLKRLSVPTKQ